MLRVAVFAVVLAGCLDEPAVVPMPVADAGEPPVDVMRPPEPPVASCSVDSLVGCRAAGSACTWCAPIGSACTRAYVDLCGGGHGWCTEASVCRQVCSPVAFPRCPAGTVERFEPDVEVGADVCYCAPE